MDVVKLCEQLDQAATTNDAPAADRVLLVYIAPGEGGLVVHRVGRGTHVLQGTGEKSEFAERIMGALDVLWPELPRQTRRYLQIGADMIAHSPIAKMLGGG